jgi:hypothetical protein
LRPRAAAWFAPSRRPLVWHIVHRAGRVSAARRCQKPSLAVPSVARTVTPGMMEVQNDPKFRADFWDWVFPRQPAAGEVDVTVVDERGFELDGVSLLPVEGGHTDTDAPT